MKTSVRNAAVAGLAAGLLAVPASSSAAEDPQRVASLNGDYPGLFEADPDATGRAVLTPYPGVGKVCYRFTWDKMQVRLVDLRRRSNNVQVAELYDEAPTTRGTLKGCSTGTDYTKLTSARVREITEHPRRFYVRASSYVGEEIAGTLRRPVR